MPRARHANRQHRPPPAPFPSIPHPSPTSTPPPPPDRGPSRLPLQKKKTEEELEEERREAAAMSQYRSVWGVNPTLAGIYGTRGTTAAPLMLIDGYNVLMADPVLSSLAARGELARAREMLRDEVSHASPRSHISINISLEGFVESGCGDISQLLLLHQLIP